MKIASVHISTGSAAGAARGMRDVCKIYFYRLIGPKRLGVGEIASKVQRSREAPNPRSMHCQTACLGSSPAGCWN